MHSTCAILCIPVGTILNSVIILCIGTILNSVIVLSLNLNMGIQSSRTVKQNSQAEYQKGGGRGDSCPDFRVKLSLIAVH